MFETLPKKLKNPKSFLAIENRINRIMFSDHKHKSVKAFVTCAWCQEKLKKKQEYIKSLGFKDYNEYQQWKQIIKIMQSDLFNGKKNNKKA